MYTSDPEQERERLAEFYRGISDGELIKLEADSESLTDIAREALEEEMDRRGLEQADETAPPAKPRPDLELRNLATIRKFRDLPEALLAKGALESVGI